ARVTARPAGGGPARAGTARARNVAGDLLLRARRAARAQGVRHDAVVIASRLADLHAREQRRFAAERPRSRELAQRARANLLGGVPMHWMVKWAGGFPLFVREASGARFVDVDGHEMVDFCLGDTGAMTGHAPAATVAAVAEQAARGVTLMLPTEDALWVGAELERRFGLPIWQL